MAINKNVLAEKQATVLSEDGNTMYATIQMRHGKESEMDKSKFVPAEMGVTTDTKKVFMAFAPNDVQEMALKKDIPDGTTNYEDLENLPSLGGVKVKGDKTLEDYGIQPEGNYLTEIPEGYVKDNELEVELAKKLDKNQGTENAGKTLVVGKDGNVIHGGNLESLAIKLTASGDSPLSIRGSSEWKVQNFVMQGKTEQVQTTGAQLLDAESLTQALIGISDGIYAAGGTQFVSSDFTPINPSSNYYISVGKYGNYALFYDSNKAYLGESTAINIGVTGKSFASPENAAYVRFRFLDNDGVTPDEVKAQKPMLNAGSTALPYEPYSGGQPSPSPDYPQEIVNAGKFNEETQKWEYEVSVRGANLFDYESWKGVGVLRDSGIYKDNGVTLTAEKNDCYTQYVAADERRIYVKPNTQYTLSWECSGADGYVYVFYNGNTSVGNLFGVLNSNKKNTFTTKNDTIFILYRFGVIDAGQTVTYKNIMLNEGSEPLPYEPYRTPQTVLLQSDRPLTKWDRLEKRDGQWGWVFKSNEKILDGSETWYTFINDSDVTTYYVMLQNKTIGFQTSYCDKYRNVDYAFNSNDYGIYSDNSINTRIYFRPVSSDITNVTEFKSWVQDNPLTIWYKTAEETFVPLTESEQSALESLTTYFPTTIITVEAGELAPEIEVEYVADTKTYIDNKFAELAQNLAATQNTLLEV